MAGAWSSYQQQMTLLIDQMVEVARKHILPSDVQAVIREPYVPYVPNDWNHVLVLAEAQNLSESSKDYVAYLQGRTQDERIRRLGGSKDIGVWPWDDGSLKLALEAAFSIEAGRTAVSNAVLWSQVDASGNNSTPGDGIIAHSRNVWAELLPILRPERIITSGKIAQTLIACIEPKSWLHDSLRLPSPNAISRMSGMFDANDLLRRYPEVTRVVERRPEWVASHRQNKIFFACHAVSISSVKEP